MAGVLLILTGYVWLAEDRDLGGAEQAVRDYVAHIENGAAGAANAVVDLGNLDRIDPRLLTDEVLDSATHRIELRNVTADDTTYRSTDDSVDVWVEYVLQGVPSKVSLEARREGGFLGMGRAWRVLDPLTVPIHVRYNRAGVGPARIGPADVPADPATRVDYWLNVYPGTYRISGVGSKYFTTGGFTVAFRHGDHDETTGKFPEMVDLEYGLTARLRTEAGTQLSAFVASCLRAAPSAPDDACPYPARSGSASNLTLDGPPAVLVDDFQFTNKQTDDDITAPIGISARGHLRYTDGDGSPQRENLRVNGYVHLSKTGTVTVEFIAV